MLAVVLLLATSANAQDDEMKPLAVLSFGGFQEMLDDLELVGQLSDNPDLAKGLEGLIEMATQGQGLPGLDKKRPWGASIASDGLQFSILAFLPVDDLEGFLDVWLRWSVMPKRWAMACGQSNWSSSADSRSISSNTTSGPTSASCRNSWSIYRTIR